MRFIGSMMRRLKAGAIRCFVASRHQRRQRFRTAIQQKVAAATMPQGAATDRGPQSRDLWPCEASVIGHSVD